MQTTTVSPFMIIGLAIRTTNANGQSATDIPQLWQQFMSQQIAAQIPGKEDQSLYCIYTDYEGDHTLPYTTVLGCKVTSLDHIPEGMVGKSFDGGDYTLVTAKGKIEEGIVFNTWLDIWAMDLPRAFTADFEVYDPEVKEEVPIFIAVK